MRRKGFGKRAAAIFMAVMMMLSAGGCGKKEAVKVETREVLAENEEETDEIRELLEESFGLSEKLDRYAGKEEKVYVIADAEGNPEEVIVSEWLKNPDHLETLTDESALSDIENVKGDETFTQEGERVTWQADGNDIYYQGTTDAELPVSVKVTYLLDGKEVSPDSLAGASGLVTVRYTYENHTKGDVKTPFLMITGLILDEKSFENVTVTNGKVISDGSRYIVVGAGLPGLSESLDLEEGILPEGFSFSAETTDFELPMALTFAECDFMMNEKQLSLEEIEEKIDDLSGQYQTGMQSLEEGIRQYTEGVDQLAEGALQADEGARKLEDGANQLNVGIRAAEKGAGDLSQGIDTAKAGSEELAAGAKELNDAVQAVELPDMTGQNAGLTAEQQSQAAQKIQASAETSLGRSTADYVMASVDQSDLEGLAALQNMTPEQQKAAIQEKAAGAASGDENYAAVRSVVVEAMVSSTKEQMTAAAVIAAKNQLIAANTDPVLKAAAVVYAAGGAEGLSAFLEGVKAGSGSLDQYLSAYYANSAAYSDALSAVTAAAGSDIQQAVAAQVSARDSEIQAACAASIEAKDSEIRAGVEASVDQMLTPAYVSGYGNATQDLAGDVQAFTGKLQQNLPQAVEGVAKSYGAAGMEVGAGFVMQAVQGRLAAFQSQLSALKNGTSQLAQGTSSLYAGMKTLSDGAGQLESGMRALETGSGSLYKGAGDLKNGTSQLAEGAGQLSAASQDLRDGSDQLLSATDQILEKLEESEEKADAFAEKINLLREAANSYQSYGGKARDVEGSVKFFIKTEGVTAE